MTFQSWAGWSQWVTTLCLLPWYQPLATSSCRNNFIGQFTYRFETVVECMVGPTENIMSKGNYWITKWCLLSQTRCKKKAQILPATYKKGTREQGHATCAVLKKLCRKSLFLTTPLSGFLFMQSPNKGKNLSLMWEETQIKWTKFILTWWRNQCQLYLFLSCCLITRFGY